MTLALACDGARARSTRTTPPYAVRVAAVIGIGVLLVVAVVLYARYRGGAA